MTTVDEISRLIIVLIRIGAIFRLVYVFIQMMANEDEVQAGKKKLKNTLKFAISAELIFALKALILTYY